MLKEPYSATQWWPSRHVWQPLRGTVRFLERLLLKLTSNSKSPEQHLEFLRWPFRKKISSSPNDFDISRKHPFLFLYICELIARRHFCESWSSHSTKRKLLPWQKFTLFICVLNLLDFGCFVFLQRLIFDGLNCEMTVFCKASSRLHWLNELICVIH